MATTLKELSSVLDKMGIKYTEQDDRIRFGASGDDQIFVFVRLREDGELISITVQLDDPEGNFLQVPFEHTYIKEFMAHLLKKTYSYKLGCWSYDPEDGDVRFVISQAIESNDFTNDQFERLIKVALKSADEGAVEIRQILATGKVQSVDTTSSSTDDIADVLTKKAAELIGEGKISEAQKLLQLISDKNYMDALKYIQQISGLSEGI